MSVSLYILHEYCLNLWSILQIYYDRSLFDVVKIFITPLNHAITLKQYHSPFVTYSMPYRHISPLVDGWDSSNSHF